MDCNYLRECMDSIKIQKNKYQKCSVSGCLRQCDSRKSVVVEENKKKYELINNSDEIAVFQVDGRMIASSGSIRCDYLILTVSAEIAILVELKGTDLRHAFEQIENTRKKLEPVLKAYKIYARIITSNRTNIPNIRTCPQYVLLKKNMMKHGGDIQIKANKLSENIDSL